MNKALKFITLFFLTLLASFMVFGASQPAIGSCGDVNGNGAINMLDITHLITYIYKGGPPPVIPGFADVNNSGDINLLDITYLIDFLYKSGPAPDCVGLVHEEIRGECVSYKAYKDDTSYAIFEVIGNDLHIHHINAYYNCCLEYVVDYGIVGSNITAVESDTGAPCDCICYFNLESILYDLENGVYVACLIGIYGDTIGVDTITVDGSFGLTDYHDSGCHEKNPTDSMRPPRIVYIYSGDSLTLEHYDAYFNCGARMMVAFEQANDTLRFYELNISHDMLRCMCYLDIFATVIGITPGDYVAEIYEQQYWFEPIRLVDRQDIHLGN